MEPENKIVRDPVQLREYIDELEDYRNTDLKVGFIRGAFDIMHQGHTDFLREAKRRCDFLIVSVAPDATIREKKGDQRPIQNRATRAHMVANLGCVDAVLIARGEAAKTEYEPLEADIAFFGGDYDPDNMPKKTLDYARERAIIHGSREKGFSTTRLINVVRGDEDDKFVFTFD